MHRFLLRLPEGLHDSVVRGAREAGCSVNAWLVAAISGTFAEFRSDLLPDPEGVPEGVEQPRRACSRCGVEPKVSTASWGGGGGRIKR